MEWLYNLLITAGCETTPASWCVAIVTCIFFITVFGALRKMLNL